MSFSDFLSGMTAAQIRDRERANKEAKLEREQWKNYRECKRVLKILRSIGVKQSVNEEADFEKWRAMLDV